MATLNTQNPDQRIEKFSHDLYNFLTKNHSLIFNKDCNKSSLHMNQIWTLGNRIIEFEEKYPDDIIFKNKEANSERVQAAFLVAAYLYNSCRLRMNNYEINLRDAIQFAKNVRSREYSKFDQKYKKEITEIYKEAIKGIFIYYLHDVISNKKSTICHNLANEKKSSGKTAFIHNPMYDTDTAIDCIFGFFKNELSSIGLNSISIAALVKKYFPNELITKPKFKDHNFFDKFQDAVERAFIQQDGLFQPPFGFHPIIPGKVLDPNLIPPHHKPPGRH